MDALTSGYLMVALIECVSFLLMLASLLSALCLVVVFLFHVVGWRKSAADLAHWVRLLVLLTSFILLWDAGANVTVIIAANIPTTWGLAWEVSVLLVWAAAALILIALTIYGWLQLARRSKARYRRISAKYSAAKVALSISLPSAARKAGPACSAREPVKKRR
jgi:hypothetical protein